MEPQRPQRCACTPYVLCATRTLPYSLCFKLNFLTLAAKKTKSIELKSLDRRASNQYASYYERISVLSVVQLYFLSALWFNRIS